MTTPAPRAGTNQAGGNKGGGAGPCGPQNAATPQVTLAAGAQTTVEWDINAAHGGSCEIKVAPTDGELEAATAIGGNFPCGTNGQATTRTVTIPADTPAGRAVLQWYWTGDGPYWNCADVTITGGGGGAAASTAAGGASVDTVDDEEGGSGGKVAAVVFFFIIAGGLACRLQSQKAGGGGGAKPPPIPSVPEIPNAAAPPIPQRSLPARPMPSRTRP